VQGNGRDASQTRAACIDAETLAAWADGGLPASDAAAVEMHLADCERCTAMLATFVRTTPEAPVAESLWTRWHLRWFVPVATAATVAALWVLVPRTDSTQMRTFGGRAATESQAAPDGAARQERPPDPTEPREQDAPAVPKPSAATDTFAKRDEVQQAPQRLADDRRADSDATFRRRQPASSNEAFATVPPPAQERDRASRTLGESVVVDAQSPTAQAGAAAPAASPPAGAPASPDAKVTAAEPAAGLRAESSARRVAPSSPVVTPIIQVISPDPMTRWRVVGAGQVERSTDGGVRWQAATLPESATFTAGSSPSPSTCWLVGRTGSIYVTTDGLRFVRVPFPDRTDFVSIQATDGRRATVVTTEGRTMRTEDQGITWIRVTP
jgi:hypothetical protein